MFTLSSNVALLIFAAVMILGGAGAAGFAVGYLAHHAQTHVITQDDVTSFNDGFATALYGDSHH